MSIAEHLAAQLAPQWLATNFAQPHYLRSRSSLPDTKTLTKTWAKEDSCVASLVRYVTYCGLINPPTPPNT